MCTASSLSHGVSSSSSSSLQLLAVFMQMGARELLMHYVDLKQTNDVQLTFEALKVKRRSVPV